MEMSLSDLIAMVLHGNSPQLEVDSDYCKAHQIEASASPGPFYVDPELDLTKPCASPAVILVSAPAAVGKTALARRMQRLLAERNQVAVYVPLQHAKIGQDFFAGRLAGVFPTLSKRAFLDAVFCGDVVLLFDGYDEVTMSSDQEERNRLFISEILHELENYEKKGTKAKASIVFLFRSVFAEFKVFDEIEHRAASVNVQFFDQRRQVRFLSEYLDFRVRRDVNGVRAGRRSPSHLAEEFLQGLVSRLGRASVEAADFFGHAIVLSAFGDYLLDQEEQNAARLAESLNQQVANESVSVMILSNVIQTILEREVQKFPSGGFGEIPNFSCYSVGLQQRLMRAVAEDLFRGGDPRKGGELQRVIEDAVKDLKDCAFELRPETVDRLANDYKDEVLRRIDLHPFLDVRRNGSLQFRNPVYLEYFLAWSVINGVNRNWDALVSASTASHYLALFFLYHAKTRDLKPYSGFLFHFISLLASSSKGDDFLFALKWESDRKAWVGHVESRSVEIGDIYISDPVLVIDVPRRGVLQNVAVTGSDECIIGITGPGYSAVRDEPIVLRESYFEAGTVTFGAPVIRFEGVHVESALIEFEDIVNSVEGLHSLTFGRIYSVEPKIQHSVCIQERSRRVIDGCIEDSSGVGELEFRKKLNKMLLWFRRHRRPEYACYGEKFQTCALRNNCDHQAMSLARFLFEKGILRKDEVVVVLEQEALSRYDIQYLKQNELRFGDRAGKLFDEFQSSTHWEQFRR